jgi:N-methylhydantoinase A
VYSLEEQKTPIELINVRVRAIGVTEKPAYAEDAWAGEDPSAALKGERAVFVPEERATRPVPVFDGHRTRFGHRIAGPAIIEQVNTTLLLTAAFDCVSDRYGSFAVYRKGRHDLVKEALARRRS